jgi:hypothetical protein
MSVRAPGVAEVIGVEQVSPLAAESARQLGCLMCDPLHADAPPEQLDALRVVAAAQLLVISRRYARDSGLVELSIGDMEGIAADAETQIASGRLRA